MFKKVDRRPSLRPANRRLSTGPDLVHLMTPGRRVVRGPNWKWGDQVCNYINILDVAYTYIYNIYIYVCVYIHINIIVA